MIRVALIFLIFNLVASPSRVKKTPAARAPRTRNEGARQPRAWRRASRFFSDLLGNAANRPPIVAGAPAVVITPTNGLGHQKPTADAADGCGEGGPVVRFERTNFERRPSRRYSTAK
jgi:hypothetical protein